MDGSRRMNNDRRMKNIGECSAGQALRHCPDSGPNGIGRSTLLGIRPGEANDAVLPQDMRESIVRVVKDLISSGPCSPVAWFAIGFWEGGDYCDSSSTPEQLRSRALAVYDTVLETVHKAAAAEPAQGPAAKKPGKKRKSCKARGQVKENEAVVRKVTEPSPKQETATAVEPESPDDRPPGALRRPDDPTQTGSSLPANPAAGS